MHMRWDWFFLQVSVIAAIHENGIIKGIRDHLETWRGTFYTLILVSNLINSIKYPSVQTRKQAVIKDPDDLSLLGIGALSLPAQIQIRNTMYNITGGFHLSPNYLGHPVNDPSTTVVIRTNLMYGIFNKPEVFINQLQNTEKSGLLLDFDSRHSILVLLEVKSLRSMARKLVTGNINYPAHVMIGKGIYVLTHEAARGDNSIQYFGYQKTNSSNRVTIANYFQNAMYTNELNALRKLDRFCEKDDDNMIVVSRHINGWTLDFLLNNIYRFPMFDFLDNYVPEIEKFHKKWGIVHGNINAQNVIVGSNGSIDLINFEYSQILGLSENEAETHTLLQKDIEAAENALQSQKELITALKTPLELKSQRILWEYISEMGQKHGEDVLKSLWLRIRAKQLTEFENSQIPGGAGVKFVNKGKHLDVPLKMAVNYLSSAQIRLLPFIITVGINQFYVTEYISTGAQGYTYRGYFVRDPRERVVVKIYKKPDPEKHFLVERFALIVTGRLRGEDFQNLITVQKEIPGELLSKWFVKQNEVSREELFNQATKLLLDFHSKWKLAHNDVRPQNIIRKPDGTLELIDFGFAKTLFIADFDMYSRVISRDFAKAQHEFEFYFEGLDVKEALRNPTIDKTILVDNYVKKRWYRGDHEAAEYIRKTFNSGLMINNV